MHIGHDWHNPDQRREVNNNKEKASVINIKTKNRNTIKVNHKMSHKQRTKEQREGRQIKQ